MPLQPPSHGLINAILESMHVLGQKEAVHQTLGNTTPLTPVPHPYTHSRRKRFTGELECRLLVQNHSRGRCYVRPNLSRRFLDDNAS